MLQINTPLGKDRSSLPPNSRSDMVGVCAGIDCLKGSAAPSVSLDFYVYKEARRVRQEKRCSFPASHANQQAAGHMDDECHSCHPACSVCTGPGAGNNAQWTWMLGLGNAVGGLRHAGPFLGHFRDSLGPARPGTSAARNSRHMKVTRVDAEASHDHIPSLQLLSGSSTAASGARGGTCSSPSVHQGCGSLRLFL